MTLLFALAVALATVPLAGGRLGRLADLELRAGWLVLAALAVQIVIISVVPDASPELSRALHMGTYALAGVFVAANRGVPGFWAIGLGGALNFTAIAANGGIMPASPEAVRAAGLELDDSFENSAPVTDPELLFLGDVFATPDLLPVDNVFSVGDVLIAVGAVLCMHRTCRSARRSRWPSACAARGPSDQSASGSSGTGVSPE